VIGTEGPSSVLILAWASVARFSYPHAPQYWIWTPSLGAFGAEVAFGSLGMMEGPSCESQQFPMVKPRVIDL